MANVDVSFLISDPDFCDPIQLRKITSAVNQYGENEESVTQTVTVGVVQGVPADQISLLPAAARVSDSRKVWLALPDAFNIAPADAVVWEGRIYRVEQVLEQFNNYGDGWASALVVLDQ